MIIQREEGGGSERDADGFVLTLACPLFIRYDPTAVMSKDATKQAINFKPASGSRLPLEFTRSDGSKHKIIVQT